MTRVRPTLDWGMVRITVANAERQTATDIPDGTFSYLADEILDVETPVAGGSRQS